MKENGTYTIDHYYLAIDELTRPSCQTRKTAGPAMPRGYPHGSAGVRSVRACSRTALDRRSVFLTKSPHQHLHTTIGCGGGDTNIPVAMNPGASAFTWILYRAHSLLSALVN